MKSFYKYILVFVFHFTTVTLMSQDNLVVNGDMNDWNEGDSIPVGFYMGFDASKYTSKSTETYNSLNAIKLSYVNSIASNNRYFGTGEMYLETGRYFASFYVKGSGWLRTVNLTRKNGIPNSTTTNDNNIVSTPMGITSAVTTNSTWKLYFVIFEVKNADNYTLNFSHNNLSAGNVMNIANVKLIKDIYPEFPESTQLLSLSVDGESVKGFSPDKYTYYFKLPYYTANTAFPPVTCEHKEGTIVNVKNASNLSGSESMRTTSIELTSPDGYRLLTYKVIFYRGGANTDARMEDIRFDEHVIEGYSMDNFLYHQYLPYSTTKVPFVEGESFGMGIFEVIQATSLEGSEADRTATITCTSADGTQTKTYKIVFEILPKLDLFLCVGQSNMAGRGTMLSGEGDLAPIDKCYLLTPGSNWEIASNPLNKYSEIRSLLSYQQIGPSYSFVKKIIDEKGVNVGLIVNARGGSAIESWLKESEDGYYASSVRRTLDAKKWGELKGILWHQGESNSGIVGIQSYKSRLQSMVNDFRHDLNDPNLFFVAGELAYWRGGGTGSTDFNNLIRTISTFLDHADYVSAEGLTPLIDETDPHFDRTSQLILGERYAAKILQYVYTDTNSHVSKAENRNFYIRTDGQDVTIINKTNVRAKGQIFNLSGMLVETFDLLDIYVIKSLSKGIYVVNIDGENYKIMI
jgi:hypothetical protein